MILYLFYVPMKYRDINDNMCDSRIYSRWHLLALVGEDLPFYLNLFRFLQ